VRPISKKEKAREKKKKKNKKRRTKIKDHQGRRFNRKLFPFEAQPPM
jgi:hypothetical protein